MHVHMTGKGGGGAPEQRESLAATATQLTPSEKAQSSTASAQRIPRFLTFDESWKMRIFHVKQN